MLDDAALQAIIADAAVEIYVLYVGGVPAGYVELDRRPAPDINIAYLGLMPGVVGRGLGRYLVNWAVDAAWRSGPRSVTVDTCTLDHPRALATFRRPASSPCGRSRADRRSAPGAHRARAEPRA